MRGRVNVWHDCDPGHDDAFALLYCLASEHIRLVGLSSVHGNQTAEKTYANVVRTLFLAGRIGLLREIPVVCGASAPSVRPSQLCAEIHGASGLGGLDWSDVDRRIEALGFSLVPPAPPSADTVADRLHEALLGLGDEPLTLLVTGCQTNVARYLARYPGDAQTGRVRVVAMAGCVDVFGNTGPWQEFNVQIDPEAFDAVLRALPEGCVTIAPLDVTHTVLADDAVIARMERAAGGEFGRIVRDLLCFFRATYRDVFGLPAPPVHDPVAAFYITADRRGRVRERGVEYTGSEPPLVETCLVRAGVETEGRYTSGAICIERYPAVGQRIPDGRLLRVCERCDVAAFWDEMEGALRRLSAGSPLSG